MSRIHGTLAISALVVAGALLLGRVPPKPASADGTRSVIVQGADLRAASDAVRGVGGEITHELGIIRAVGATGAMVAGPQA